VEGAQFEMVFLAEHLDDGSQDLVAEIVIVDVAGIN
jgi:hypothetical protein